MWSPIIEDAAPPNEEAISGENAEMNICGSSSYDNSDEEGGSLSSGESEKSGDGHGADMDLEHGEFKRISDLTPDEIHALQFGSEDEAYEFYTKYAKCHGVSYYKHSRKVDNYALEINFII
ncbi:unnamed protein product [Cuscuta epithymum]|uniref:Protein FAR1-RELATED SEQUENCE n=1 Tax=Cuscuta epithymum TaxID=186058 RepID=A0AAV0EJX6_9ASTE|nr:unnamed protein product [Cuscuta epithymum]